MKRGKYSPINPVSLSTNHPAPNQNPHNSDQLGVEVVVSGVAGDNSALMEQAASLWICKDDVVVDATFGRGVFWRLLKGLPTHAHDLKMDGIDCRKLPYEESSIDVLVLDPPYRPNHGNPIPNSNGLAKSYGLGNKSLETMNDVLGLYDKALIEAARVVKKDGRVMVKCQDMSYDHRLHLASLDVLRSMVSAGFEFADQFVLINRTQLSSPKWEKQERARRSHSILWVGVRI